MKFVLEDQLRGKTIYQDSILNKNFHSDPKWVTDSQIHNRRDSSGAHCTVLIPSWLVVTRRVPRLWLRFFASRRWEFIQLKLVLQRQITWLVWELPTTAGWEPVLSPTSQTARDVLVTWTLWIFLPLLHIHRQVRDIGPPQVVVFLLSILPGSSSFFVGLYSLTTWYQLEEPLACRVLVLFLGFLLPSYFDLCGLKVIYAYLSESKSVSFVWPVDIWSSRPTYRKRADILQQCRNDNRDEITGHPNILGILCLNFFRNSFSA